jgi:hypothetical protein
VELFYIYKDTFWKIWLRLVYLSYLLDCLVEKVFDLIVATIGYGKIAHFIRTYGTGDMTPITNAVANANITIRSRMEVLDEEWNGALWRCYYGSALIKEVWTLRWKIIRKKRPITSEAPVLSEEDIQQLLG